MRFIFFYVIAILCLIIGNASAGEIRAIKLNDGSILCGEVSTLSEGIYTIKTISLGDLKVKESEIYSIRSIDSSKDEIQAIRKKLTDDDELLKKVLSMQNDPEFQKVMKDPAIIEAVNAGDMNKLLSNPDFRRLLNNPKILDIRKELKE